MPRYARVRWVLGPTNEPDPIPALSELPVNTGARQTPWVKGQGAGEFREGVSKPQWVESGWFRETSVALPRYCLSEGTLELALKQEWNRDKWWANGSYLDRGDSVCKCPVVCMYIRHVRSNEASGVA